MFHFLLRHPVLKWTRTSWKEVANRRQQNIVQSDGHKLVNVRCTAEAWMSGEAGDDGEWSLAFAASHSVTDGRTSGRLLFSVRVVTQSVLTRRISIMYVPRTQRWRLEWYVTEIMLSQAAAHIEALLVMVSSVSCHLANKMDSRSRH